MHKFLIDGALLELAYRENVMAARPQSSNDRKVATLVREKAHAN